MKRIGFIIFLIGLTLFINFEARGVWSTNLGPGFPSEKGSIYAETHYLFSGENKFYYSAEEGYEGELFGLNREQTEHLLQTNEINYIKKLELENEGMVKFNTGKTGFYTFVIKNTSEKDSHFEYSIAHEEDVKDCIKRSLYIAVFGIFIIVIGVVKNRMKKQHEK